MRNMMIRGGVLLALVASAGCGGSSAGPSVKIVSGKVLLPSGQPAHGAEVAFEPKPKDGKLKGAPGYAALNPDGSFAVKSMGDKNGLAPGYYAVVVNPLAVPASQAADKRFGMMNIPRSYWDENTTVEFVEITGEKTDMVIQLK